MAIQHKLLLYPDFVSDNHMVLTKIKQSTKNGSNFGHISSIRGDGVGNCGAACSISCGASFNSLILCVSHTVHCRSIGLTPNQDFPRKFLALEKNRINSSIKPSPAPNESAAAMILS